MTPLISSLPVQPIYQSSGPDFILGAQGEERDITQFFNLLYNYRAHENAVCFLSDNFGYVTGQITQLIRGFTAIALAELQRNSQHQTKLQKAGIYENARTMALSYFEDIPYENFVSYKNRFVTEYTEPLKFPNHERFDIEDLVDMEDKTRN